MVAVAALAAAVPAKAIPRETFMQGERAALRAARPASAAKAASAPPSNISAEHMRVRRVANPNLDLVARVPDAEP